MHARSLPALTEHIREVLGSGQRLYLATVVESHLREVPPGTTWAVSEEGVRCFLPPGAEPDGARPVPSPGQAPLEALQKQVVSQAARLLEAARQRPPGRAAPARERMGQLWWPPQDARDRASVPTGGDLLGSDGSAAAGRSVDAGGAEARAARVRLFTELLEPPPRLILVGAGQDAPPLCRIGAEAGFEVHVADPRPAFARPERFPEARDVRCVEPGHLPREWFAGDCYAVVMNHHFLRDAAALRLLLELSVPYIGVLGPRSRTERLLARLQKDAGRSLAPEELHRIYSPVGLDIGGESPGAIALGIVAEIVAFRHGRPVPHLRDRRGPLHPDRLQPAPPPGRASQA